MDKKKKRVSLLIPVKLDDPKPLSMLLKSLDKFNYFNRKDFEVFVVDDASPTSEVEEICKRYSVRYLKTKGVGKSAALNLGIKQTDSEFLAFVDQDIVILDDKWLDILMSDFSDEKTVYVSGKVVAYETSSEASKRWEKKGALNKGSKRLEIGQKFFKKFQFKGVQVQLFSVGTNYVIRNKVLKEIGGYDERFGPGGLIGGAGADLDIGYKVLRNGYQAVYDPRAVIAHQHPTSMFDLRSKLFTYGISDTAIHTKFWVEFGDIRGFFQIFYRTFQNFGRMIRGFLGLYPLPPRVIWESIRGNIVGPVKYFSLCYPIWSNKKVKRQ